VEAALREKAALVGYHLAIHCRSAACPEDGIRGLDDRETVAIPVQSGGGALLGNESGIVSAHLADDRSAATESPARPLPFA
jgi:hypothetical protein